MILNILGYSILAGIATVIGALLVIYKYKWARHNSIHLMSFAAGIMLAVAFLHLIPEAIHLSHEDEVHLEEAGHKDEVHAEEMAHEGDIHADEAESQAQLVFIVVLLGFAAFYAVESMILLHPRHDVEDCNQREHGSLSIISIVGLTFHSLIDGIVITVGFKAGSQIGIMTTIAVILHEMPEGIVTTSILLHNGMEKLKTFWFSVLVAVATPVGAIVSYFILGEASVNVLRIFLAIAAGSFIYIAAADLIPETHEKEKWFNTIILLIGMAALYAIGQIIGHGH